MSITSNPTPNKDQIFDSTERNRHLWFQSIWVLLIGFELISRELGFTDRRIDYFTGIAMLAFFVAYIVMQAVEPYRYARRVLRRKLEAKVKEVHSVDVADAPVVGVTPGIKLHKFEGDTAWDVGFLLLEQGKLIYLGDISAFELSPEQITKVEIRQKFGLGVFKRRRLIITWRSAVNDQDHSLAFELWSAKSVFDEPSKLQALQDQIEQWRLNASPTSITSQHYDPPPTERLIEDFPPLIGAAETVMAGLAISLLLMGAVFTGIIHFEKSMGHKPHNDRDALVCLALIIISLLAGIQYRNYINAG